MYSDTIRPVSVVVQSLPFFTYFLFTVICLSLILGRGWGPRGSVRGVMPTESETRLRFGDTHR